MPDTNQLDLAYSNRREAAERQASALATDLSARIAHKALALLYEDRVVAARKAINADSIR